MAYFQRGVDGLVTQVPKAYCCCCFNAQICNPWFPSINGAKIVLT